MDDPFELYLDRLNVQDILYYAGYRQNRRDGLRYPSFVRLDNDGRRIHGDKFICMPGGKTCFKPPTIKSYNIISLITSFPEFFQESATKKGADLVHAVCRSILNMPEEDRNTQVLQPLNTKPFNIKDYKVHELHGCNPEELKYFMPYMRERGISLQTLKAFSKDVMVTQKNAEGDKFFFRNFSFPFQIPGNTNDIVGLEERGRARLYGTSGYKGMALGTNASEGLWIASPKGTALKDAKHVYWFESGYDAMAYYQLHHRQNPKLCKAVFLSTGGNPSVMQFRGVIKQATAACHHLCFDNDLAGKQYVMNLNTELQRVTEAITKANEKAPLKDLGTYDIPEWALCALENGDYEGLSDEETTILNEFMEKHFPEGFVSTIDWDKPNEFNVLPAFGSFILAMVATVVPSLKVLA